MRWQGVFLLALLIMGFSSTGLAASFKGCRKCHQDELRQAEIRLVQHEPFMQKKCASCHLSSRVKAKNPKAPPKKKAPRSKQKIKWLAESSQLGSEHGFVLPASELGEKLVIDLRGEQMNFPRQEVDLPLLKDLEAIETTDTDQNISSVKVLEVKRGVFLSVLIGWKTEVLADAQVHYGVQDLSQRSERSKRYGRFHKVRLQNLKPDEQYQFQVVSTDLSGRSRVSEIMNFSTKKPFKMKSSKRPSGGKIDLQSIIRRFGDDYFVQLKTDSDVAVFVGCVGKHRDQKGRGKPKPPTAGKIHKGLSTGVELGITACLNCHQHQKQATHPVNVLPKPGMIIPEEYPTLPDGRISCASCHLTHSSDHDYLAIRRGKRELCVGCHKDML